MRAAFRVDASLRIGSGHVMRCLVLADRLRALGAQSLFVSREQPGHLGATILERGHDLRLLEPLAPHDDLEGYAGWLGTDAQTDARDTLAALPPEGVDWLVVDHYALDHEWEARTAGARRRLLVIDDLANRRHLGDLLLDQNLGREPAHYAGLTSAGTRLLTGPRHALMREDFAQLRPRALERRACLQRPSRVLVALGGVDADNTSAHVLTALERLPAGQIAALDLVLGQAAPHRAALDAALRDSPLPARLHVNTPHMAQLMANADLAIGAAGVSAWERCSLGLPSLLVLLAENQRPGAQALAAAGAALWLGEPGEIAEALPAAWQALQEPAALQAMQERAAGITDGAGAQRVAQAMMEIGA